MTLCLPFLRGTEEALICVEGHQGEDGRKYRGASLLLEVTKNDSISR